MVFAAGAEKPVLLVFWSIFCGTCRDELPILEQEKPKYLDKVQIITVNLDEAPRAKTVKGFAKQQGFTMRMLQQDRRAGVPDRPGLQGQGDAGALSRQERRDDRLALWGAQPRGVGRGHRQSRVITAAA
jgi:thiol-disulfide isomerase/thioredoxin